MPDSIHNVYNEICIKQKSQLRIQAALLFKVTMFEKPPKSLIFKTLLSHSVLKSHKSYKLRFIFNLLVGSFLAWKFKAQQDFLGVFLEYDSL